MRVRTIGVVAALMALAGCGAPMATGGEPVDDRPEQRDRARAALARFDAARARPGLGVVGTDTWTSVVGDWSAEYGEKAKSALTAGMFVAEPPLPTAAPAPVDVRLADGTVQRVRVLSAAAALDAAAAAGQHDCPTCAPLRITAARPTSVPIATLGGEVTAPAWEYTLDGTTARLVRVAVDPADTVELTPPPWDSPPGMSIEGATGAAASRTLTVHFTGSRGPADRPCGVDYTTETVESDHAVVVIVVPHPYSWDDLCDLMGFARTAEATLTRPLGDRAVLEVREGRPVPVTRD